ncbi:MAG: GNAT family N-acetyltransferase [Planctomycetes bacterium]|nr:GNAT family N-acetyltransferase [Planctomycetota bacterium]
MVTQVPLQGPIPLEKSHDVSGFDCGAPSLNDFLHKYAWQNQQNRSARTYVVLRGNRVVAYYLLAAGSVRRDEATARVAKGLANHPVPIFLLARLAVDQGEKRKGVGAALLKDALLRSLQAADIVGCRAVLVHAKDQAAQAFYRKFGFESSPVDEFHLFLLMKDIKASVASTP